jgi:hypothetical protein
VTYVNAFTLGTLAGLVVWANVEANDDCVVNGCKVDVALGDGTNTTVDDS